MMLRNRIRLEVNKFRLSPRGYIKELCSSRGVKVDEMRDLEFLASLKNVLQSEPPSDFRANRTIVILSFLPLPYVVKMEGVLGRLLEGKGWDVKILANQTTANIVNSLHGGENGFEIHFLESFLSYSNISEINQLVNSLLIDPELDVARIKLLMWRGVPVGLHAMATYLSSLPEGRFENSIAARKQLKRILRRSMLHVDASAIFLGRFNPSVVLGMEKGFVGTCELFYVALLNSIKFVQWVGCHEPNSFMLKKYIWESRREHPFSICESDWNRIRSLPWRDSYRDKVMDKFEMGYKGGDWFKYKSLTSDQNFSSAEDLKSAIGLDKYKKTVVIYSHILSDANLFYGTDIFENGYEEWLIETVRRAMRNDAVNWVLKLHPANKIRNSRLGYAGEYGEIEALRSAFGKIPNFLHVVYPETKVSPFSFFQITDVGITVRGTVGIELPCFGIPVLTAGTGRYSGKGFTYDSSDIEAYLSLIDGIHVTPKLSDGQVKLAVMYAYFIFYARPARYDQIFLDKYQTDPLSPRYRDFELCLPSIRDISLHPQMKAILEFIENDDKDFFDSKYWPTNSSKQV